MGINYARMARLRPVTGYRGTWDWTEGVPHPDNDGVFKVNIQSGKKELLISFRRMAMALRAEHSKIDETALFINHTLCNRENDRIFLFARGGWSGARGDRINAPFVIRPDGSGLTRLDRHIGGHPEWDYGERMIGRIGQRQIVYDVDRQLVVGALGNPDIFPNPEGDVALSPDGKWFVNGHKDRSEAKNFYTIYRRADGAFVRSRGFNIGQWASGDLRQDPSPCWNRTSDQILVPAVSADGQSRQLFVLHLRSSLP